ncbi:MAG: prephenate dehydratase domain-containing protein [Alphaproteobacteria bacterium]|jgi:prephenate dehydratase
MRKIACQGCEGAFSHLAAKDVFAGDAFVFFPTFEETLSAVREGQADHAVIPVENSEAGRVSDIHTLLPASGLFITGEHFLRIRHHLLGLPGTKAEDIRAVRSHVQALSQCARTLAAAGIKGRPAANTAVAARETAAEGDPSIGAIASETAAELYGLSILRRNMEDSPGNTTRFLILSAQAGEVPADVPAITSFVFRVRNIPAALYKALGGFATNGVNILRLESYVDPKHFVSAAFFVDIESRPEQDAFRRAFDELDFFSEKIQILGTYPADPYRMKL